MLYNLIISHFLLLIIIKWNNLWSVVALEEVGADSRRAMDNLKTYFSGY